MYYNMRVRTVQRKLRETHLSLTERKRIMLEVPEEALRKTQYSIKRVGTIHGKWFLSHVLKPLQHLDLLFGCLPSLITSFLKSPPHET